MLPSSNEFQQNLVTRILKQALIASEFYLKDFLILEEKAGSFLGYPVKKHFLLRNNIESRIYCRNSNSFVFCFSPVAVISLTNGRVTCEIQLKKVEDSAKRSLCG